MGNGCNEQCDDEERWGKKTSHGHGLLNTAALLPQWVRPLSPRIVTLGDSRWISLHLRGRDRNHYQKEKRHDVYRRHR